MNLWSADYLDLPIWDFSIRVLLSNNETLTRLEKTFRERDSISRSANLWYSDALSLADSAALILRQGRFLVDDLFPTRLLSVHVFSFFSTAYPLRAIVMEDLVETYYKKSIDIKEEISKLYCRSTYSIDWQKITLDLVWRRPVKVY